LHWFASRLDDLTLAAAGGTGGEAGQPGDVGPAAKDAKTRLQEYLQGRGNPLPEYELIAVRGSDHDQHFSVACRLSKPQLVAEGSGKSRRKAEQAAARVALQRLVADGR
jgi:ribonuclease-3